MRWKKILIIILKLVEYQIGLQYLAEKSLFIADLLWRRFVNETISEEDWSEEVHSQNELHVMIMHCPN